ncbi:MAG: hypothetical protein ACI8T1_003158 [Verrucomicrobiales bacterium]|jgi:hypothetical protein
MKTTGALLLAVWCLGFGLALGGWVLPSGKLSGNSHPTEGEAASILTEPKAKVVEQKPLGEDIPQAATAQDLLNAIESANHPRSQAQMYLAVERLGAEQLATLAREADVLARKDLAWSVQSAIVARWTELAPMDALSYAKALKGSSRANAVSAVFRQLGTTNPRLTERQLPSLNRRGVQRQALRALAAGLADANPQQGISMLKRNSASSSDYAFREIATKWALLDPSSASSYAAGLTPGRKRDNMIDGVARAWASIDADGALGWARTIGDSRLRRNAVVSVIGRIAKDDPDQAMSLVEKEPRQDQNGLRQRALSVWFENDHEAAMEWINVRPNQAERLRLFYGSAHSMLWEDPERAYKLVKDLPKGAQKIDFMGNILSYWSWNDPNGGLEWLQSFKPKTQGRLLVQGSLWGLAEGNPEGFQKILDEVAITDQNKRAFRTLGSHLMDQDPDEALELTATIDSPSASTEIMASLYRSWAYREPSEAGDQALALEDKDQRNQALEQVASSWANNDPEKALEWAESLSGESRDKALGSSIQFTAAEDPLKAAKEVERLLSDGAGDTHAAETAAAVARTWTASDPKAAADWSSTRQSEKARKEAVAQVAGSWSRFDPVRASEWIGTLSDGPERDAAASQLAQNIRSTEPESAFLWASTIQDEHDRVKAVESTINTWKESSEAAARQCHHGFCAFSRRSIQAPREI